MQLRPLIVMFLSLAPIAISCNGCRQQGEPPASTADGVVTFKGQPVTGGTLTFHIEDENGKSFPLAGELDAEGNYKLTNAVPGKASITVETATQKGLPNFFPLPEKFAKRAESGLTFEIKQGHQEHNIELE